MARLDRLELLDGLEVGRGARQLARARLQLAAQLRIQRLLRAGMGLGNAKGAQMAACSACSV